jgi:hypothetical protein
VEFLFTAPSSDVRPLPQNWLNIDSGFLLRFLLLIDWLFSFVDQLLHFVTFTQSRWQEVAKNTQFMIVRGPDGNNSSCFRDGSKILSSLPSCQLTLSLLSQARSTGRLQSHIPGTIWSSPSRYRACGLTAKRGAAGQYTKELYVSLSLSLALLCFAFQLSSD